MDKEIIRTVLGDAAGAVLSADDSLRLLDAIGIARDKALVATTIAEAKSAAIEIGYPVNMRSIDVHEPDRSETIEDITDENTMRLEFKRLMQSSDVSGVTMSASMAGARAYFGIRSRAKYGHLIICAAYPAQNNKPSEFVACTMPVTREGATEAFRLVKGDLQLSEVLFTDTLRRLSALAAAAPQIDSMDITPVVASAQSVVAIEASVSLK